MTARDRTVLMVVGALALMAAFWFGLVAPKRHDAKALDAEIATAQQRLDTAKSSVEQAQRARAAYAGDYATVARLGKAVPADDDMPSLVYQLQHAAARSGVDFRTIQLSSSGGGAAPAASTTANATPAEQTAAAGADGASSSSTSTTASTPTPAGAAGSTPATGAATQTAAATLPPGAAVGPAGFPTMPFDFQFDGRFFTLDDFLRRLDAFTQVHGNQIVVRGRLLTVDGISLSAGPKGFPSMTAKIHATAYLVPQDQGLTAGATAAGPSASTPVASGSPTSSGSSATSTATVTGVGK